MSAPELHRTLIALISALEPGSHPDAPDVVEAELDVPMEVWIGQHGGRLTAFAGPASSRWETGVMAPVHHVHITATVMVLPPDDDDGEGA